ncbi:MAG: zinc ribbon domain-containing protein [Actinomycetota bacterium]
MDLLAKERALNAEPQQQITLLEVQRHDLELDRVRHRRATLPEAVRVTEIQTAQRTLADGLTAVSVEVADLELEQRKADNDVDLVRQRSTKDRDLLDSGSINDAKQLTSLQHELESLARRQSELEDIELEVMERLEDAQHRQAALLVERDQLVADLAAAEAARDAALAGLADEETAAKAARASAADGLPAELMALYDKLRADNGGIGAAALQRGRCEGCRIELTPVDLERIRAAAPAEVVRCEECRRILVRTPESGL